MSRGLGWRALGVVWWGGGGAGGQQTSRGEAPASCSSLQMFFVLRVFFVVVVVFVFCTTGVFPAQHFPPAATD